MGKGLSLPKEARTLAFLIAYFVLLALLLLFFRIGQLSWIILALSAIAWFIIEARRSRERALSALKIGVFLLLFDFVFENLGWLGGLWQTYSPLAVGVVPLEVMCIALFGGAAWALYLPRKLSLRYSVIDSLVFGFFGALGERLLIMQGLFAYHLWWNSGLAFLSYFLTWLLLHFVRYRILPN